MVEQTQVVKDVKAQVRGQGKTSIKNVRIEIGKQLTGMMKNERPKANSKTQ